MKKTLLVFGAVTVLVTLAGSNASADDILTIEGYPASTAVTLDSSAIITAVGSQGGGYVSNGHTFNNWSIFVQDSSGALQLFGALPSGTTEPNPTVGDIVNAAGTFSPYHQVPEVGSMTSLTQISTGNSLPTPPAFTVADLTASMTIPQNQAGYVLQVQSVQIYTDAAGTIAATGVFPNANTPYYLKDSLGNIMEMYYWVTSYSTDADMVGTPIPTGPVNVTGFVSQSGAFPVEITPLGFSPVPEPASLSLLGAAGLLALVLRRRRA